MDISVRHLQNDTIKPSDNGGLESGVDWVTHKFLIRYKTERSFIPPQISKMTTRLRQFCGCEVCIIPKDKKFASNIFRTKLVTYLQKKYIGIHKMNSAYITTSDAHYKENVSRLWIFTCSYQKWSSVHLPYYY